MLGVDVGCPSPPIHLASPPHLAPSSPKPVCPPGSASLLRSSPLVSQAGGFVNSARLAGASIPWRFRAASASFSPRRRARPKALRWRSLSHSKARHRQHCPRHAFRANLPPPLHAGSSSSFYNDEYLGVALGLRREGAHTIDGPKRGGLAAVLLPRYRQPFPRAKCVSTFPMTSPPASSPPVPSKPACQDHAQNGTLHAAEAFLDWLHRGGIVHVLMAPRSSCFDVDPQSSTHPSS